MKGTVRDKIRWGTTFLFLLMVFAAALSVFYIVKLKNDSKDILTANYESIEYCHSMQSSLDSITAGRLNFLDSFAVVLAKQQANITEQGEANATAKLSAAFTRLKQQNNSDKAAFEASLALQDILNLNMQAIKSKNEKAVESAKDATTILIAILFLIFIIGFTFAFNFPSILTNPIQKLKEAIKEIGQKNYGHRIHINSKDEFGEMATAFNEMAERLEYFESSNLNKILYEKARAEAVINSLKDASIGIDKDNRVLFANSQALQLLGLESKDIAGRSTTEISGRNELFKYLLEERGNAPLKIIVDNRENFFIKEIIEIGGDGTNSRVITLRNITSFKELDVAKTNFIATISHELKTPLASSDFSLTLLSDKRVSSLTAEQQELVQQLKNDNQRMLRILSELLNMSQIEAGKIQLDIKPVQPAAVIESSLVAVNGMLQEKNLAVRKNIADGLPAIDADFDKLTWVLNNFLTNAIRYAPLESEVSIVVELDNDSIVFSVGDNGPGIDPVYQQKIFERYFQVPGRSDKKGSGIGLAICKEFIDAMDGKIWVKSAVGEGSTFGFNIPVK